MLHWFPPDFFEIMRPAKTLRNQQTGFTRRQACARNWTGKNLRPALLAP